MQHSCDVPQNSHAFREHVSEYEPNGKQVKQRFSVKMKKVCSQTSPAYQEIGVPALEVVSV